MIEYIILVIASIATITPFLSLKMAKKHVAKELEELYITTIQEQKAKIRQLYGQLTRLQQENEIEEDDTPQLIQSLSPLLKKYNIPPELISDPAVTRTIRKYKHLIPLVAKFLPQQGNSFNQMV